jgi:Na+/H+ antiporter NhaC
VGNSNFVNTNNDWNIDNMTIVVLVLICILVLNGALKHLHGLVVLALPTI